MITLSNEDFLTLLNAANAAGTTIRVSIGKDAASSKPDTDEWVTEDTLLLDSILSLPISYRNHTGEVINTTVSDAWAATNRKGPVTTPLSDALSQLGMKITKKGTLFVCGTHEGLLSNLPEYLGKGVNSVLRKSPHNANGFNVYGRHSVDGQQLRGVEFTRQAYLSK